jgi:hypothetical protein
MLCSQCQPHRRDLIDAAFESMCITTRNNCHMLELPLPSPRKRQRTEPPEQIGTSKPPLKKQRLNHSAGSHHHLAHQRSLRISPFPPNVPNKHLRQTQTRKRRIATVTAERSETVVNGKR